MHQECKVFVMTKQSDLPKIFPMEVVIQRFFCKGVGVDRVQELQPCSECLENIHMLVVVYLKQLG